MSVWRASTKARCAHTGQRGSASKKSTPANQEAANSAGADKALPLWLKIMRSPRASRMMEEMELVCPGVTCSRDTSTPSRSKCVRKTCAAASSPMGPTKPTSAPRRARATAALADMPPTPWWKECAGVLVGCAGNASMPNIRSSATWPTHSMRGLAPPSDDALPVKRLNVPGK